MAYDPAKDPYRQVETPDSPASLAYAVDPSDTNDLGPLYAKMLFIGVGGDVALTPAENQSDDPVVFKNAPDGSYLLVRARRVWATGTTATSIVALAG